MSTYQIGILGQPENRRLNQFHDTVAGMVQPFGLTVCREVAFLDAADIAARDRKSAFVGVYFGADGRSEQADTILPSLIGEHIPIIPVVEELAAFSAQVPEVLHFANGMALSTAGANLEGLAAIVLECLGLLRRQRRVFVSYRRVEAANAALQLHDTLSGAGFDVFLDTHMCGRPRTSRQCSGTASATATL